MLDLQMLDRLMDSAHAVVAAVGIDGKNDGKPGFIAEIDAWRFVAKTMREMRHGIALGGKVDIEKLASYVAEHIGAADPSPIAAIFSAEKKAFEDHFIAATEKHGERSHFHEDHGVMDAHALSRKINHHTGVPEGEEREPPKSAALNHAAFAKVKAAKGVQ